MSSTDSKKNVTVTITYCGGWGYAPKFQAIEAEINKLKLSNVKVVGVQTQEVTGWLEVQVGDKLVHSKKNGDGYVNTKEKLDKILQAVTAAAK